MERADRTVEKKGKENDWEEVFRLEAETESKFMKFLIKSIHKWNGTDKSDTIRAIAVGKNQLN